MLVPSTQVVTLPLQVLSLLHILPPLPLSTYPLSHIKIQKSPKSAVLSSPSEQSISPLSGAVSGGQDGTMV